MSEDTFVCHNLRDCYWHGEARAAAKFYNAQDIPEQQRIIRPQNTNNAEVEKLCFKAQLINTKLEA